MVMVATLTRPTAPSAKRGDVVRMVQAVWRRVRREDKRVWKDERERACVCGVEKRRWKLGEGGREWEVGEGRGREVGEGRGGGEGGGEGKGEGKGEGRGGEGISGRKG